MMQMVVVIVLLNGVQMDMPAPAYLIEGRCWVPLRPIVTRLGYEIQLSYDAPPRLTRGGKTVEIPVSRKIKGTTYVPASWLRELGVGVRYDARRRTLSLTAILPAQPGPRGGDQAVEPLLAQITKHPEAWAGRPVTLEGEFLGWNADPLCQNIGFGPPVTRSDWVLRGEGGCIYCTGILPFSTMDGWGRRARVNGVVRVTRAGWPYLAVKEVQPLKGLKGLACALRTDGYFYGPKDTVQITLLVRNDNTEPMELVFPSGKVYDFTLTDADGRVRWRWSEGRVFTQAVVRRTLQPGESYEIKEKLNLASIEDLSDGLYSLRAELPHVATSYVQLIKVERKTP